MPVTVAAPGRGQGITGNASPAQDALSTLASSATSVLPQSLRLLASRHTRPKAASRLSKLSLSACLAVTLIDSPPSVTDSRGVLPPGSLGLSRRLTSAADAVPVQTAAAILVGEQPPGFVIAHTSDLGGYRGR